MTETTHGISDRKIYQIIKSAFITDKNNIKYQLRVRLKDYKFSKELSDETSSEHKRLKNELKTSVRREITFSMIFT